MISSLNKWQPSYKLPRACRIDAAKQLIRQQEKEWDLKRRRRGSSGSNGTSNGSNGTSNGNHGTSNGNGGDENIIDVCESHFDFIENSRGGVHETQVLSSLVPPTLCKEVRLADLQPLVAAVPMFDRLSAVVLGA